MGRCTKITSGLLSGLLAFIFITAGIVKLTPKLSVEAHKRVVCILKLYAVVTLSHSFSLHISIRTTIQVVSRNSIKKTNFSQRAKSPKKQSAGVYF